MMKIVDMHCDTITELCDKFMKEERNEGSKANNIEHKIVDNNRLCLCHNDLHIDIEKLKKGNYLLQNFAIFQSMQKHKNLFADSIKYIDFFYQQIEANKDMIAVARCYEDIRKNEKEGKISAILTLEEGAQAEGNLEYLRTFYRLGVRMVTLTWNFENGIGYPNFLYEHGKKSDMSSRNTIDGLTDYGVQFVEEMERLGMIIDVSHLSDKGFYDVLKHTKKPFVASHSNAVHCCNNSRNLTDDMIRRLADRGGVTGINFYPYFLEQVPKEEQREAYSSIDQMIAHMKHIKQIGGIDCIGLGTDFDGIDGNLEIKDASNIQTLVQRLEEHFTTEEIEKICYKNVLRVYKEIL